VRTGTNCEVVRDELINFPPEPSVSITTDGPTSVCEGNAVELTASVTNPPVGAVLTYLWRRIEGNNTADVSTDSTITVTEVGRARYQVIVTAGVCQISDQTNTDIRINERPTVNLGQDRTVCDGVPVTLSPGTGNGNLEYAWRLNGGSVISTQPTFSFTPALGGGPQTYSVTVTNNFGCDSTDEVVLNVGNQPTVSIAGGAIIEPCENDLIELTATATAAATFQWLRNGNEISGATQSTFTPDRPGRYVVVSTEGDCDATSNEINVADVRPAPRPDPPEQDTLFCASDGETLQLDAGPVGDSYLWPQLGETSRRVTVTVPDVYVVEITNAEGCTETVEFNATEFCNPRVFLADAFSPNGDGANDTWEIFGDYAVDLELRVFNRWGEVIWIGNDLNEAWDGTSRGAAVPLGTYPWTLTYRREFGNRRQVLKQSGTVLLVR
ncbi:MAG: gliding motility-associated C-terminal domain-containing protein, partial [Catalinimonas sp.]